MLRDPKGRSKDKGNLRVERRRPTIEERWVDWSSNQGQRRNKRLRGV